MNHRSHRLRIAAAGIAGAMALAACGGDDGEDASARTSAVSPPLPATTTAAAPTTVPPSTVAASTTAEPASPSTERPAASTTVDDSWREDTRVWCDQATAGMAAIAAPISPDDVARYVGDFVTFHETSALAQPEWPAELTDERYDLDDVREQADESIDRAVQQLAAGNIDGPEFSDTASGSIDRYRYLLAQSAAILAIAGVRCGPADPNRMANADLNVPLFSASQLETGFGSVWVSTAADHAVHRIDPDTGTELAVIDVDSSPIKLQPANGRMIVRTADAYVAIDPTTNTVTASLAKSDVGPAADRSWAADGALWICDGQRVHRYDPTTFEAVTTIELGFNCGQVYATGEVAIPWSYNQDEGESGTSVAAFIDLSTNEVRATVDLPVDVNVPIVLDDSVFFPAKQGAQAVVVDSASWTISATPEFGRVMDGSQAAYDGKLIYVIADDAVAVIDPVTFELTETIEAFNFDPPARRALTSLAVSPGALWAVNRDAGTLQRFDRPA